MKERIILPNRRDPIGISRTVAKAPNKVALFSSVMTLFKPIEFKELREHFSCDLEGDKQ